MNYTHIDRPKVEPNIRTFTPRDLNSLTAQSFGELANHCCQANSHGCSGRQRFVDSPNENSILVALSYTLFHYFQF